MKKIKMRFIALGSILGLGTAALYTYRKVKKVQKDTNDYILEAGKEEYTIPSENPKRKYISLSKKGKK